MATDLQVPVPADEEQRLRELERYGVIGTASDQHFDRIVALASSILGTPMSAISLVDADRQWFLARKGIALPETSRAISFCAHAIAGDDLLVVPDALADERFRTNPLVTAEPHLRFYAGAPLQTPEGHKLGTLCTLDQQPRHPSEAQLEQLRLLGDVVMRELELRRLRHCCPITGLANRKTFLAIGEQEFQRVRKEGHPLSLLCFDIDNFRQINNRWGHHHGDEVLFDLCKLAKGFLREQDYAGRLGDGEFALLFVGLAHGQALAIAEALREAVTHMGGVHIHSDFKLHISGGLTSVEAQDRSFSDVVRRADQAMELAKINGRNQIAILLEEP
jgi:diguanylate cyclase (GGDEF)-like protein